MVFRCHFQMSVGMILLFNYYSRLGQDKPFMFSTPIAISKCSFDGDTEDSEVKAPRPRPMESEELPPEFKLEQPDICEELRECLTMEEKERGVLQRRHSLDMHYSILGFINRKIREKSRQRIMSQDISHHQI